MNWNEMEQLWRQAPAAAPAEWNAQEFAARRERLARTLARRDWLEAGAGIFVAAIFAGFLWFLGITAWSGWTAVGLVLLVSIGFVRERRRARRLRPEPEVSLRRQIEGEIAELQHQRRLLQRVGWWYLLPLGAAALLFAWALLAFVAERTGHFDAGFLARFGIAVLVLHVTVWWLNRRAITQQIEPRLRACEAARAALLD